ncbi:bifunctional riboflavin kinase/FAD synthetase [Flavobacterium sp.]|uniref:bifunctional riboflavin kinase/FAD synthetase n=1 Tax=Flavobacterium sp. TaxID=239 RepID=UPI0035272BCD
MKIYKNLLDYSATKKSVLTIGTFDGVHLGHQEVLKKVVKQAKELNYESVLLTFFPHPRMVLQKDYDIKLLNTIEEKAQLLAKTGLQNLIVHPFNLEFSRLSAEEFVRDILVQKLNIGKIIIGYDHRFGRNRTANINDLINFGNEYGFEVQQISAEEINQTPVSSTKIRNALLEGNITEANCFLGYPYFISGKVVHGKKLGRTLSFPTANINVEEKHKLIPKNGVYVIKAKVKNNEYNGMMSIGTNPTVPNDVFTIEAHLFNFNEDIYNKEITIQFLKRIRNEQKFSSITALQCQLEKDKEFSLDFFKTK